MVVVLRRQTGSSSFLPRKSWGGHYIIRGMEGYASSGNEGQRGRWQGVGVNAVVSIFYVLVVGDLIDDVRDRSMSVDQGL